MKDDQMDKILIIMICTVQSDISPYHQMALLY